MSDPQVAEELEGTLDEASVELDVDGDGDVNEPYHDYPIARMQACRASEGDDCDGPREYDDDLVIELPVTAGDSYTLGVEPLQVPVSIDSDARFRYALRTEMNRPPPTCETLSTAGS
jgi:hypothetical protein